MDPQQLVAQLDRSHAKHLAALERQETRIVAIEHYLRRPDPSDPTRIEHVAVVINEAGWCTVGRAIPNKGLSLRGNPQPKDERSRQIGSIIATGRALEGMVSLYTSDPHGLGHYFGDPLAVDLDTRHGVIANLLDGLWRA